MARLEAARDGASLRDAARQVLGKRSELAHLNTLLRDLPAERRKEVGAWINSARTRLQARSDALVETFDRRDREIRWETERLDLTEFTVRPAGAPTGSAGTRARPPQPGHPDSHRTGGHLRRHGLRGR